ncbi:MAG: ABC transporter permease [Syntrophobacter sp.]
MAELIIDSRDCERQYWRDVWTCRELLLFLAWRDILVRYKQTVLGVAWVVLRPFVTMVVFTVVFERIANLPGEGTIPYTLMVYAGVLPWQFFSSVLTDAGSSLTGNAHLISKIYFPRLIIPAGSLVANFVDFLIAGGVMALFMSWYGWTPDWRLLLLPLFTVLAVCGSAGPGLIVAALSAKYRDFRFVVPFLVQFGLFLSPVGFSSTVIPGKWRLLYACNPLVGIIGGFRWTLLGGESQLSLSDVAISMVATLLLLVAGVRCFRQVEKTLADVI